MKKVCISGGFDPFHDGHLGYVLEASKLGDYLIVLVSNDNDMIRKKGKYNVPLWFRIKTVELWLKEYNIEGIVLETKDIDGTQTKSLKILNPNVYAEGGDVTKENINKEEERVCKEIGCEIAYKVGKKINASSKMKAIDEECKIR